MNKEGAFIMLTKDQFDILYIALQNDGTTQRDFAGKTGFSLGKVNSIIKALQKDGLITSSEITPLGIEALSPYKVDNAIIMAAGLSSRFAPLSYEKPKGLYKVKDEILIEREIEQLHASDIMDITVVVGYMKEKFFYLEEKYNVKLMVNEDYYKYNNTSTLYLARKELKNTYICSSDNYFTENVFEPYVYDSYYAAAFEKDNTGEYFLAADKNGLITNVTIGGGNNWYMLGHAYFSRCYSKRFTQLLEEEYAVTGMTETKSQLWENLYMKHIKELGMYIHRYEDGIIYEFDSLDDLRKFDSTYIDNIDNKILSNICRVLKCNVKDVVDIVPIKEGLTNTSFKFTCHDNDYVYRHPGIGTDKYICRQSEAYSMEVAKELDLDGTFIYMDENEGWKISRYIANCHILNYHDHDEVEEALRMVKKLHWAQLTSKWDFNRWKKTNDFVALVADTPNRMDFEDFDKLYELMKSVYDCTEADKFPKILCHCDCYNPNFITDGKKMYLIDWEYSGNDDPANDIGTFICCADYTYEEALQILKQYFGRELTQRELRHYIGYVAIAAYYWFVWAVYQESVGNTVGEYLYLWYKYSKFYGKKAVELYPRA